MRTRIEILSLNRASNSYEELVLEVLLDIRDLLYDKRDRTFPVQASTNRKESE